MATRQVRTTLDEQVRKADPDFDKDKRKVLEYQFTDRDFYGNPAVRGAYAPEEG